MNKAHQSMRPSERFEFIGGQPCLDFANTLNGRRGAVETELLNNYADLVDWSLQAQLVTASEAALLLQQAANSPKEAAAVLERACTVREALYGIFSTLSAQKPPPPDALHALNRELEQAMAGAQVVANADGFEWSWGRHELTLDQMLGPVARSAATLLTSEEWKMVRQCASDTCGWLFVDTTKNHRRRWCSAAGCGNRERVQRHRQHKRDASHV